MRIRSIKPEFWQSESVGRLSRDSRLLFIALWSFADDSGRGRGAFPAISGQLFPFDEDAQKSLPIWFSELEAEGMVRRYQVDGAWFFDIPKWFNHQKIEKASKSRLPPFPESSPNPPRLFEKNPPLDLGSRILDLGSRIEDLGSQTSKRTQEDDLFHPGPPSNIVPIPGLEKAPAELPQRLRETWKEICLSDGPEIANKALRAGKRIFHAPSQAQLLETWKAAAAAGRLGDDQEEWPDFRKVIDRDKMRDKNQSAIDLDPGQLAFLDRLQKEHNEEERKYQLNKVVK